MPASHEDLLHRPLFGHVATLRPDGQIQVNPMWYLWDGARLRLTTSTPRQKFRNVTADDRLTMSVHDPDQPYRYLELRGRVEAVEPDPQGAFFDVLADRYQLTIDELGDRPQRVVLVVRPEKASSQ
ncbi:PPOX class F420-dependent oxidoreductase [Quadrisphaera granulorum]|uniref:PPOX class F420-dependent oxidoreductase n=1 Tax=Quadrisphaera granulorum TaxID=317664 RepID=UPI001B876F17|nr:PPOX class F420-dependent oxidoreductase [Quadrisphaera granulorum]